jgi:hypothetical protein
MKRALVVEGSESTKKLVREVGELAAGVDAELLLLHIIPKRSSASTRPPSRRSPIAIGATA